MSRLLLSMLGRHQLHRRGVQVGASSWTFYVGWIRFGETKYEFRGIGFVEDLVSRMVCLCCGFIRGLSPAFGLFALVQSEVDFPGMCLATGSNELVEVVRAKITHRCSIGMLARERWMQPGAWGERIEIITNRGYLCVTYMWTDWLPLQMQTISRVWRTSRYMLDPTGAVMAPRPTI